MKRRSEILSLFLTFFEGITIISLFFNIGILLFTIFPRTTNLEDNVIHIVRTGFSLGNNLKMFDIPGILIVFFTYYVLYLFPNEVVYFGGLKEVVTIPTDRLRYIARHSFPSVIKGFLVIFWFMLFSGLAYMNVFSIHIQEFNAFYLKVFFDTTFLGISLIMFLSNYAFLIENPHNAIMDFLLVVFWIVTGHLLSGQSISWVFHKINFLIFQVAVIYILSLPLKGFFYAYLVFNFAGDFLFLFFNWDDEFSQNLSLSIFIGFFLAPFLMSALLIFSAIMFILILYITILIPYTLIFKKAPIFPVKAIFPFHFLFTPYTIIVSYILYLVKHSIYQFISLFLALLTSSHFYRKNLINTVITPGIYEKAQNEKANINNLENKLNIPDPLQAPVWLWPLAILSLSVNIFYLINHWNF